MTRGERIALNSITVIMLHFLFWLCNYYPRHILEVGSWQSIISVIFNLLYFIVYSHFLIVSFSKNRSFLTMSQSESLLPFAKKYEVKKIAFLVLFQIVVDVLLGLLRRIDLSFSYPLISVILLLYWVGLYIILAHKDTALWKDPKTLWPFVGIMVIVVAVSVWFDYTCVVEVSTLLEKYYPDSSAVTAAVMNVDHVWGLKTYIMDTVVFIILSVFHPIGSKKANGVKGRWTEKAAMVIGRFVLMLIAFILVYLIKVTAAPQGVIGVPITSGQQGDLIDGIQIQASTIHNTRKDVTGEDRDCLDFHYYVLGEETDGYIMLATHESSERNQLEKYENNGLEGWVYRSIVICYYDNGNARMVYLPDLPYHEENATLTMVCKKLLYEGRVYALEYVYDYLLKYDPAFIRPYFERYAAGDFSFKEYQWMADNKYRQSYVTEMAKAFLQ